MLIAGLYSRHDGGYVIFEDGHVVEHIEFERYNRIKESGGDSFQYFKDVYLQHSGKKLEDFDYFVAPMPTNSIEQQMNDKYDVHSFIPKEKVRFYSHHLCHAANAYFSSPFNDAISISIDNAGMDDDQNAVSCSVYMCKGTHMKRILDIPAHAFSLGDLCGRATRFIFKLWSGFPRGHQAGSVMAMAALGKPERFIEDFRKMMTTEHKLAITAPPGMKRGVYVPPEEEVIHPYLNKYRLLAEDEQTKFDLAASLQLATEEFLAGLVEQSLAAAKQNGFDTKNICFSGGCSLNSVSLGKIWKALPDGYKMYVPPVPYDGGLAIGAAQYHYHSILGNPKYYSEDKWASPYLGESSWVEDEIHVQKTLSEFADQIEVMEDDVGTNRLAELLAEGKIIAVFQGRSESGRRALGNRSILANPAIADMKQQINDKVKHRQWYRPFAPSVLDECGDEWFVKYFTSPYMSFVFDVKPEKRGKAPAIEHFDGTARLQSVKPEYNQWYYGLIHRFYELTGIPMVLNTSFNDREPIVENPTDAMKCFLKTDIDYLYLNGTLVAKKK